MQRQVKQELKSLVDNYSVLARRIVNEGSPELIETFLSFTKSLRDYLCAVSTLMEEKDVD
jgi:hypothetical protein